MNSLVPRSYSAYYTPTAAQQEAARQVSAAGELYLVHDHGHTGEMAVPWLARCSCRALAVVFSDCPSRWSSLRLGERMREDRMPGDETRPITIFCVDFPAAKK